VSTAGGGLEKPSRTNQTAATKCNEGLGKERFGERITPVTLKRRGSK